MSLILAAYNVIKPLPPEGSEEWLAMLPGWTGWKYDQEYPEYFWQASDRRTNLYFNWDGYQYGAHTSDGLLNANSVKTFDNGVGYYPVLYHGFYYFRGDLMDSWHAAGNIPYSGYKIARATSLTPQR